MIAFAHICTCTCVYESDMYGTYSKHWCAIVEWENISVMFKCWCKLNFKYYVVMSSDNHNHNVKCFI